MEARECEGSLVKLNRKSEGISVKIHFPWVTHVETWFTPVTKFYLTLWQFNTLTVTCANMKSPINEINKFSHPREIIARSLLSFAQLSYLSASQINNIYLVRRILFKLTRLHSQWIKLGWNNSQPSTVWMEFRMSVFTSEVTNKYCNPTLQ